MHDVKAPERFFDSQYGKHTSKHKEDIQRSEESVEFFRDEMGRVDDLRKVSLYRFSLFPYHTRYEYSTFGFNSKRSLIRDLNNHNDTFTLCLEF